ncbi:MAG: MoaD/ThiS family protein [Hyphomicrobiaceae bacterium]
MSKTLEPTTAPGIGHNAADTVLTIEARFFNSLAKYSGVDGLSRRIEVRAGTTIADLIARFGLPMAEIFLVLRNGRDITPGLYQSGNVNGEVAVQDGDVIAFSGPVPYSYGYGAPVV